MGEAFTRTKWIYSIYLPDKHNIYTKTLKN